MIVEDVEGGAFYRPDTRHRMHPYNVLTEREPRLRQWLDEDAGIQAFIAQHQEPLRRRFTEVRAQASAGPIDAATILDGKSLTKSVLVMVGDASRRLGPADVPEWVTYHYIAQKLIPLTLRAKHLTALEPVGLWALSNGMITMSFTGASQNERRDWEPLIKSAQTFFGHRKDPGGRKRRDEGEESSRLALVAAKLHHWRGWRPEAIDAFLELPHNASDNGATGDTAAQRGRRYIDSGEKLLVNQHGGGWKTPPDGFEAIWRREEGGE